MMSVTRITMKNEKLTSVYLLLASIVLLSAHGRNIPQDSTSSLTEEQEQEQEQNVQKQLQEELTQRKEQSHRHRMDLIRNNKLTPVDISYLVMNQLQHQLRSSIPGSPPIQETRRSNTYNNNNNNNNNNNKNNNSPDKESTHAQVGKVRIVVRPVLTSQKWLRLCQSRSRSVRFPGCNNDLMRDRQKREEMLRNNLAALLSGLKGQDGRQRLRMPSLRFG